MRSRAHIGSHPLHPMLIAFPLAFLVGMLVADLWGLLAEDGLLQAAGAYMSVAALVTGLAAAVPGLIDYVYTVPPDSSAKKRATQHMLVNVTALLLAAFGMAFRDWGSLQPGGMTVLLELAAVGFVSVGGWLGGTLSYRNQIGVDHRYAHSGKWREENIDGAPGETVSVSGAGDMKPGQMWLLHWGGKRLVLGRTEEGYQVFNDHCTHKGGSLAGGALVGRCVQCPWHGSQFEVTSGEVKAGPAEKPINALAVQASDGGVKITLPA